MYSWDNNDGEILFIIRTFVEIAQVFLAKISVSLYTTPGQHVVCQLDALPTCLRWPHFNGAYRAQAKFSFSVLISGRIPIENGMEAYFRQTLKRSARWLGQDILNSVFLYNFYGIILVDQRMLEKFKDTWNLKYLFIPLWVLQRELHSIFLRYNKSLSWFINSKTTDKTIKSFWWDNCPIILKGSEIYLLKSHCNTLYLNSDQFYKHLISVYHV